MTVSMVTVKQTHVKISMRGAVLSLVMTARAIVGHLEALSGNFGYTI